MKRVACPKCREKGNDTSGDNLVVYHDHAHCYACGYHESYDDGQMNRRSTRKKKKKKFLGLPDDVILATGIEWRNITEETCKIANVKELLLLDNDDDDDSPSGCYLFPFYNDKKRLIGYKSIDYYARYEMGQDKNKTILTDGEQTLGGLHLYDPDKPDCCIWEGEIDWLTAIQCDQSRNHFWIPGNQCGDYVRPYGLLLRKHKNIYIGADNDDAGDILRDTLLELLPTYKTKVINYDEVEADDLSHAYELGGEANYFTLISTAYEASGNVLLYGEEMRKGFLNYFSTRKSLFKISSGIDIIDDLLNGGLSPAEFIMLTAETGLGKSTLAACIAFNIASQGHKIMWIGTEMQPYQMLIKFAERYLRKKIFQLIDGTWSVCDRELNKVMDALERNIIFYNSHRDTFDRIEEGILSAIYTHDVRVCFIDVVNDMPGMDEWQSSTKVMKSLEDIASGSEEDKRPPITVFGVCHQKDVQGHSSRKVSLVRMAGGKVMRQKPTAVIGMEGDISDDTVRYLKILKMSRMEGTEVWRGKVEFDLKDRAYYDYDGEDDDEEQSGREDKRYTTVEASAVPVRDRESRVSTGIRARFSGRRRYH